MEDIIMMARCLDLNLTSKKGNFTMKNGDSTMKNSDLTIKQTDLTIKTLVILKFCTKKNSGTFEKNMLFSDGRALHVIWRF